MMQQGRMLLGREGPAGLEDRGVRMGETWQVCRGQTTKGLHEGQVEVFSACPCFTWEATETFGGEGGEKSDTIRFAFCKDQNCVNWTAVQQEGEIP